MEFATLERVGGYGNDFAGDCFEDGVNGEDWEVGDSELSGLGVYEFFHIFRSFSVKPARSAEQKKQKLHN